MTWETCMRIAVTVSNAVSKTRWHPIKRTLSCQTIVTKSWSSWARASALTPLKHHCHEMDFKAIQNHVKRYVNCDPAHATQWLLVAPRQGKARQGKARQGKARQGEGKARQGKAKQGKILASCVYKTGNIV